MTLRDEYTELAEAESITLGKDADWVENRAQQLREMDGWWNREPS